MKINLKALSALGLLSAASAASAADAPAAPSLGAVLESSGITATGYVSTSYYHLSTDFGLGHQFDTNHSTFALDQAALTLAFQPKEGFGAVVNVIAGQDAKALNAAEDSTGNDGIFNVTQAFLQYANGGFTIIAGKYVTLAGAEVIAPTGNTNYSRSLLFTNLEPLTHTGIRASFAPSEVVSFSLGVNNGWNIVSDYNAQRTIEAGVTVTPSSMFSVGLTGYFGNESANGSAVGSRNLIDLVATVHATEALSFVLNYDNLRIKDVPGIGTVKSDGFALYGNWAINDMWRLSLRLEQIKDDVNGLLTGNSDEKVKEATFTVGLMPTKSSEIRFEVRKDKSSGNTAADDKLYTSFGNTIGEDTDSQTEFAIQGLFKF